MIAFSLLMLSCDKATFTEPQSVSQFDIQQRSSSYDISWIQDFQQYMQTLHQGQSSNQTFTNEEYAIGIEFLFNYKFGNDKIGITEGLNKSTFNISDPSNRYQVYNEIELLIQSEIEAQADDRNFSFVDISFNNDTNELVVDSHFSNSSDCIISNYNYENNSPDDCSNGPFTNQEYFVGLGGEDGEENFFPCDPSLTGTCGESVIAENQMFSQWKKFKNSSILI